MGCCIVALALLPAVSSASTVHVLAGGGSGPTADGSPAKGAGVNVIDAVEPMADGGVLFGGCVCGAQPAQLFRVTPAGRLYRILGRPSNQGGYRGDGGPAAAALACGIYGVASEPDGSIVFSDSTNGVVRRISAAGTVVTYAGTATEPADDDICASGSLRIWNLHRLANGDVEGALASGGVVRVRQGVVTQEVLIPGETWDVRPDPAGGWFATSINVHQVVHVAADATTTIVAGTGVNGFKGDGGPATLARLSGPRAILPLPTPQGTWLAIADSNNSRIRVVDPAGIITTLVGSGGPPAGGTNDNVDQLAAAPAQPRDLDNSAAGLLIAAGSELLLVDKTTIIEAPRSLTDATTATVRFESWYPGPTFQCRLDGAAWTDCASPVALPELADGEHRFEVRGIDDAGVDPTPASTSWRVDTTGPSTYVTAQPEGFVASTSASVAFDSPQAGATFTCRLDGAAAATCTSPVSLAGLSQGEHSFEVTALDGSGHPDPTPAVVRWTADTVQPDTSFTTTPPPSTTSRDATFAFTSTEAGSTFECRLDTAEFEACASPVVRTALNLGSHTFRVRALDRAGNTDSSSAPYTWKIDRAPPTTTITSGPAPATSARGAVFDFESSEAGSSFTCRLDSAEPTPCFSPRSLAGLADGQHRLEVHAVDPAGNVDPVGATYEWIVDNEPPAAALPTAPPADAPAVVATPLLRWSPGSDALSGLARHAVRIDSGVATDVALEACDATACSLRSTELTEGRHTWRVIAVDRAGNTTASESRAFTVDITAPAPFALGSPDDDAAVGDPRPAFAWTPAIDASGLDHQELWIDGATAGDRLDPTATSARAPVALPDGEHRWKIVAVDPVDNSRDSAERRFVVDTVPPDTAIAAAPPPATQQRSASFELASSEPGSTFRCAFDDHAPAVCSSPHMFIALPDGAHTLTVRAVDRAGNADPAPATYRWIVDNVSPVAPVATAPPPAAPAVVQAPLLTWTPSSDDLSGVASYAVRIDTEPAVEVDAATCDALLCSLRTGALTEGRHTWRVTAIDRAGNASTATTQAFTVDATPPAPFALGAPADGTHVGDARPAFGWTLAFDVSGLDHQELWIDGAPAGGPLAAGATSARSPAVLADGEHRWRIVAVDPVGLRRETGEQRIVVDTAPPVARLQAGPERTTPGVVVTVDAGASHDEGGAIVRYEFDLDGDGRYETDGGGEPRFRTSYATVGTRLVAVRVTDAVGLQSVARARVAIVDKTGSTVTGQIAGLETIPSGVRFVKSLHVRLLLITPPFASAARISNGGDLNDAASIRRVAVVGNARVLVDDWTLATPADPRGQTATISVVYEIGPDTVYRTLTLFVDLVAPDLRGAAVAGRRIRVKATDSRGSGVRRARTRRGHRSPSAFRRLSRGTLRKPGGRGKLEVQVADQAGNRSRWRPVRG